MSESFLHYVIPGDKNAAQSKHRDHAKGVNFCLYSAPFPDTGIL